MKQGAGRFCAVKRVDIERTVCNIRKGRGLLRRGRRYGRMIEARGKACETTGAFWRAKERDAVAGGTIFPDADERFGGVVSFHNRDGGCAP